MNKLGMLSYILSGAIGKRDYTLAQTWVKELDQYGADDPNLALCHVHAMRIYLNLKDPRTALYYYSLIQNSGSNHKEVQEFATLCHAYAMLMLGRPDDAILPLEYHSDKRVMHVNYLVAKIWKMHLKGEPIPAESIKKFTKRNFTKENRSFNFLRLMRSLQYLGFSQKKFNNARHYWDKVVEDPVRECIDAEVIDYEILWPFLTQKTKAIAPSLSW